MPKVSAKLPFGAFVRVKGFRLRQQEWSHLEKAYGRSLPKAFRLEVEETTTSFIAWSKSAQTQPLARAALADLRTLEEAGQYLLIKIHNVLRGPNGSYISHA